MKRALPSRASETAARGRGRAASLAGYSGTPLAKKLGIGAGARVLVTKGPEGLAELLAPLPEGADLRSSGRGPFELALLFTRSRADLRARAPAQIAVLGPKGALWICWPKKASGIATDLSEDGLREIVLPLGWVDTKVCAIDATWSGLRFSRRRSGGA